MNSDSALIQTSGATGTFLYYFNYTIQKELGKIKRSKITNLIKINGKLHQPQNLIEIKNIEAKAAQLSSNMS